jgi:hypothetical protein
MAVDEVDSKETRIIAWHRIFRADFIKEKGKIRKEESQQNLR